MIFFGKKEKSIRESINSILNAISEILESVDQLFELVFNEEWNRAKELVDFIRAKESEADRIRRNAETELYSGAFLPNMRGDLLGLIESIDRITNRAESLADMLFLQRVAIPVNIRKHLLEQFSKSKETFEMLKIACEGFFEDFDAIRAQIIEVENKEHEEDAIERKLIERLFSSDIPLSNKLQLNELVRFIGDIADLSEDVSDRLEIIIMKRRM